MKNLWMWMILVIPLVFQACHSTNNLAQSSVPDPVKNNFNHKYPYAHSLHWDTANGIYIARFNNVADEQKEAFYWRDGTLLRVSD